MKVIYIGGSMNGRVEVINELPMPHSKRFYVPERNEIEVYQLVITGEGKLTYQYAFSEKAGK